MASTFWENKENMICNQPWIMTSSYHLEGKIFTSQLFSIVAPWLRVELSYDTHPEVLIIRGKFCGHTPSSFGGVQTHTYIVTFKHKQTELCFIIHSISVKIDLQVVNSDFPLEFFLVRSVDIMEVSK